jgi:hypothetical protein
VIFLHTLSTASIEDLDLLSKVVESLQRVRRVSKQSERVFQVCDAFLRLAQDMTKARETFFGNHSQADGSLQLPIPMTDLGPAASAASAGPSGASTADIIAILTDWVNGEPAEWASLE